MLPPPPLIAPIPPNVRPALVPLTVIVVAAEAAVTGRAARHAEPSRTAAVAATRRRNPAGLILFMARPFPDPSGTHRPVLGVMPSRLGVTPSRPR